MTNYLVRLQFVAWIAMAMWFAVLIVWALDRTPPPAATAYTTVPAKVGEAVLIEAKLDRQLSRGCSRMYSQYVVDSNGTRIDIQPLSTISMALMYVLEKETPGVARVAFTIPKGTAPGPAMLLADYQYVCNPVHQLFPIRTLAVFKFKVLP